MNILSVCGAGSGITIDGDLEGSISSLYEKEKTQGHATQQIIAKIIEMLPESQRLTAYTAYLGCVEKQAKSRTSRIDTISEAFNTTYPENSEVITFLEVHDKKIIYVNSVIDTSIVMLSSISSAEESCSQLASNSPPSNNVTYVELPLPNLRDKKLFETDDVKPSDVDCNVAVVFRTINKELDWTSGGTGIMQYPIQGFFSVKRRYSGSVTTYILEERPASVELQAQLANEATDN
ncbi:hypothetical protein HFN62_16460 [Rhizobium leguminosarum]|uniref:hypothetical protein n=1 Tax=Rhizobium leguminosarum TaxID=384 RepID=UPI001C973C84|nr:hypothetical protein [Rhizobium leguminosarum]MBY5785310.1 hypothetical protein [Rhizobium leguminosarum]